MVLSAGAGMMVWRDCSAAVIVLDAAAAGSVAAAAAVEVRPGLLLAYPWP